MRLQGGERAKSSRVKPFACISATRQRISQRKRCRRARSGREIERDTLPFPRLHTDARQRRSPASTRVARERDQLRALSFSSGTIASSRRFHPSWKGRS